MIVEEEKAHKKMCPYEQGSEQAFNCQGSKCMAWRWADEDYDENNYPIDFPPKTRGYCGLAGRP